MFLPNSKSCAEFESEIRFFLSALIRELSAILCEFRRLFSNGFAEKEPKIADISVLRADRKNLITYQTQRIFLHIFTEKIDRNAKICGEIREKLKICEKMTNFGSKSQDLESDDKK